MIHLPTPVCYALFPLVTYAPRPLRCYAALSVHHPPPSPFVASSRPFSDVPPFQFQPATTTPFPRVLPVPVPVPHTHPCPNPKSKHTVNSTERRQVRSAQVALTYTMMPALLNILPCQSLRSESRLRELTECSRMHTSCTHRCVLVVVATIGPTWRR